jgi:hypothetical protein
VQLRQTYPASSRWGTDLAYWFVDLSLQLLSPTGVSGFVLPRKVLSGTTAAGVRQLLAERGLVEIADYRGALLFPKVGAYVAIVAVGDKPHGKEIPVSEVIDSRVDPRLLLDPRARHGVMREATVVSTSLDPRQSWTGFDLRWQTRLREAIGIAWVEMGDSRSGVRIASGTQTGANERLQVRLQGDPTSALTVDIDGINVPVKWLPRWAKGGDITPFQISAPVERRILLPVSGDRAGANDVQRVVQRRGGRPNNVQLGNLDVLLSPKVILRTMAREPAAVADYDGDIIMPKGTAGAFAIRPADVDHKTLDAVAALLNSSLYQWLMRGFGDPKADESVELSEGQVRRLPWPTLAPDSWLRLSVAASEVYEALRASEPRLRVLAYWDARRNVDELVFDLLNVGRPLRETVQSELVRPL